MNNWVKHWGPALVTLVVAIIGSGFGFNYLMPNGDQVKFRSDHLTVNAQAVSGWGADADVIKDWGMDVEFVSGEADVMITVGTTGCIEVEGFGKACAAGETTKEVNSRRWITQCNIVLNAKDKGSKQAKDATLAHEFGHCLTQEHNDAEDSIMGSVLPSKAFTPEHFSYTVTDDDRANVARLYHS